MTTPGGDVGEAAATGEATPVAVARRGPDRGAMLAWGGAILVVVLLAGLAAFGVRAIAPRWPAISERWQMAILEAVDPGETLPFVQPLPGAPPVSTSDADAMDAGRIITEPTWLVRPRGEFPIQAQRQGIGSGRVQLTCPVSAGGEIRSCWIVSEVPADAGFGQAALAGAVHSRLQPRTVDGVAVDAVISFTTRFELE